MINAIIKYGFLVVFFTVGMCSCVVAESIVSSKHNLSVSGPGTVIAQSETQICIFCHTPHSAMSEAPLWNRYASGETYIPYASTTAKASFGQPTGNSKLCLSCHDGTVALGMVRSRSTTISFSGGISVMPPGDTNLGTDLSDDHPVSFVYDSLLVSANSELNNPSGLTGAVRLDSGGQIQCSTCHNPHDNQFGKFLNMSNTNSALCVECHTKAGWTASDHRNSSNTWNHTDPDPWPHTDLTTVTENGCENCHRPHSAGGKERLLNFVKEEDNCFTCHNGNVAGTNIISEFNKASVHPVGDNIGFHDPAESALVSTSRHVECADCHNPHTVNDVDGALPGSLGFIQGVSASGTEVNTISNEYELCFRCHADTSNTSRAYINRQYPETNTREEFNPSNFSYHPVETIGKNLDVPSLINPWTTSSTMTCSDCHNNDQGPGNSGTDPNGPHGSVYSPLLERRLEMGDFTQESAANYALCYKCHDRNSIRNDDSFDEHKKHIYGEDAACTVCHDSHGASGATHLINFDLDVVSSSSSGILRFDDLGTFQGRCYLTCHGENHNPETY